MKIFYFLIVGLLLSCNVEGVKNDRDPGLNQQKKDFNTKKFISKNKTLIPTKVIDFKEFENGIKIKWFKRGNGELIKNEEVIAINYQVFLEDGTLVDGNELLSRASLPFLVGYGLQTKGWDLALTSLQVGDFVEIFIPADLARGKTGVKGLIPPNANNIIRIKIIKKIKPTNEIDGIKIWLLEQNKNETRKATEENQVEFHYIVGTKSNPKYDFSYQRNKPFKFSFNDRGVISGLKKALKSAKRSDKLWVVIPPNEAYGETGLLDLVKPNEKVFYDVFVMEVY